MRQGDVRKPPVGRAIAVVLSVLIPVVVAAEENEGRGKAAFATSPGSAPERLRDPDEIRQRVVPFDGDLKPIGDERAKTFLKELCPDPPVRERDGSAKSAKSKAPWHCQTCPGSTSRAGQKEPLVLEKIVFGDFLESGEREAFVTYRGCEPASMAHGGAVVFRKRKGNWEAFYRHPGLNAQQCLTFQSEDDIDRLVCRLRFKSKGRVVQKIVDASGGRGYRTLARSTDNTAMCPTHKFVSSYLSGWSREDLNNDGKSDLLIGKIQRWTIDKKRQRKACRLSDIGGKWSHARRFEIEYHFNGKHLQRKKFRRYSILGKANASLGKGAESESVPEKLNVQDRRPQLDKRRLETLKKAVDAAQKSAEEEAENGD